MNLKSVTSANPLLTSAAVIPGTNILADSSPQSGDFLTLTVTKNPSQTRTIQKQRQRAASVNIWAWSMRAA